MTLVAGTVSVDDDGNESFDPEDYSAAKLLYFRLKSDQESLTRPDTTVTPPVITINRDTGETTIVNGTMTTVQVPVEPSTGGSQAQAKIANTMAAWLMTDIVPLLVPTIVIPADSDGDGLQTSQNPGDPTTHPASPKTLTGTLT